MSSPFSCQNCGRPLASAEDRCIYCYPDWRYESANLENVPNTELISDNDVNNIPRLGEFLLTKGLIDQTDLENTLTIQAELASKGRRPLLGQILIDQGLIDRSTLNQIIFEQIILLQAALEESNQRSIWDKQNPTLPTNVQFAQVVSPEHMYQIAISNLIQAETIKEVTEGIVQTFDRAPHVSIILLTKSNGMQVIPAHNYKATYNDTPSNEINPREVLPVSPDFFDKSLISLKTSPIFNIEDSSGIPTEVLEIPRQMGHTDIAMIPITGQTGLAALILLGTKKRGSLTTSSLEPYINLAKLFSKTLVRISHCEGMEKRCSVLQNLNRINIEIALVTDINELYQVTHEQISNELGQVDMLIFLYDASSNIIRVPYAYEDYQIISLPPFPLGEGLVSNIINTAKPLLLVEKKNHQVRELGIEPFGSPAKSYLGVPLIVSGAVSGAIIVKDGHQEQRFDEEDLSFINTIASHVVLKIRDLHLLEENRKIAERERTLNEISTKIWSSTEIDEQLRIAIYELGHTLRASKGLIQLELSEEVITAEDREIIT